MQGYGHDGTCYATLDLWTGPHTTTPASVSARRVGTLASGLSPTVVGGGWFITASPGGGFDAWSLADGTRRTWTPPSGIHMLYGPLYATVNDVCVLTNFVPYRIDPNTLPIVP